MSDLPQPNKGCFFLAIILVMITVGGCIALGFALSNFPAFNDQKKIQVCDVDGEKTVVIPEDDFNSKVYSKNLLDCPSE